MKDWIEDRNTERAVWSAWKKVVFGVLLSVVFGSGWASAQQTLPQPRVSPEQQKRIELMKSKGTEASLTILPVRLGGRPFDRVSEVVGMLLEQQGLKNIELGKTAFDPGKETDLTRLAGSLGDFIGKNPITTEYALYAEFNGNREAGLNEIRAVVLDKTGAAVWTDHLTGQSTEIKNLQAREPMTFSVLLVERLSPELGLNETTAKAAKPGKMAAIMSERSGLPPESETAPLPERQKKMKETGQKATLLVYPARIRGDAVDAASATELAKMINGAQLCKVVPAKNSMLLKASQADPNELKTLWGLAREFRDYAKKNPVDADYVLYADLVFTPGNWEQGFVHFVVCDRKGEWVIVDFQNSHHDDYRSIKPTSKEGCEQILLKRLEGYLR
jgi:hypothetical protein